MKSWSSSTSAPRPSLLRHGTVVGSMSTESTVGGVHVVGQSSDTLSRPYVPGSSAYVGDEEDWLEAVRADRIALQSVIRIPTCPSTEYRQSFLIEAPIPRSAEHFRTTRLFSGGRRESATSHWEYDLDRSWAGRVIGLAVGAEPIAALPGLLSSTDVRLGRPRLVESKLGDAVARAGEEWFEDGVESRFARALSMLLHGYRDTAVAAVETFLRTPDSNIEVAVEAAQWLGEADHPTSHHYRRTVLENLLRAPSARLRHGAAAGLASMNDPASLPSLLDARDHETNRRLGRYLQLVVDQVERTRACPSS